MPEPLDPSAERLDTIEHKLDALSLTVAALSASVDRRFDEVTQNFVEQREYTEFAFTRLRDEMIARFDRLERKVDRIDHLERKIDRILENQIRSRRGTRRWNRGKKR
jgi:uncharacterized protein Yka (UPF0111/DUF47 family)